MKRARTRRQLLAELGQSHLIAPNRGKIEFGQDLLVVGFAAREALQLLDQFPIGAAVGPELGQSPILRVEQRAALFIA